MTRQRRGEVPVEPLVMIKVTYLVIPGNGSPGKTATYNTSNFYSVMQIDRASRNCGLCVFAQRASVKADTYMIIIPANRTFPIIPDPVEILGNPLGILFFTSEQPPLIDRPTVPALFCHCALGVSIGWILSGTDPSPCLSPITSSSSCR